MSALEGAILAPVVLLITLMIIQTGFYLLARNTVTNAAQVAVEIARAEGGSAAAGRAAATGYLAQVGGPDGVQVSVTRGAQSATATVTAPFPKLTPILDLSDMQVTVNAPVERLTQP